jgi:hypothetical protein
VVYVVNLDGNLYAYAVGCNSSGGTCSPLWTGAGYRFDTSSPAVANGVVYVGDGGNDLLAFAVGCNTGGGTCNPLWTATTGLWVRSAPAVANGVVYVTSGDRKLYAFGLYPLDHLALSPGSAMIAPGGSQAYIAEGFDTKGNSMGNLTAATTFTISGGGSCTGATCTSTLVGDHTVTATNGTASGTATLKVATVPGKPTGVSATRGNAAALVSWTAPADNGGSAITGYAVISSPGARTCTTTGALSCTVAGLTNGQAYSFTVSATNGVGTGPASDSSTAVTPAAVPGSPTGVTASAGNASALVSWTAPAASGSSSITGYTVTASHGGKTCTTAGALSCTVGDLTIGTTYTFTVRATNGVGTGLPSNPSASVAIGAATHLTVSIASPYVAGAAHSVTVTALDAYGNTASGYRGTIHFTSSDTKAVLPADYKFTAADAGTHVFSITLKTVGSQGVRATDTVTSTITGAQYGIVVTPGAARTLAVSGIASPYVAGVAHSVTVTALDAYGNTATGYRGTVGFTSTDAKATLPANYTFTAADSGVHNFSVGVTLKTAGNESVRARDTVTSTITGGQYPIVVTAAAATTLTVSGLTSPRTHGTAGTITVTVRDAYGNVATGYRGTVTFTSTDSHAILPANYTFTAANAGTHTFSVTPRAPAPRQSVPATRSRPPLPAFRAASSSPERRGGFARAFDLGACGERSDPLGYCVPAVSRLRRTSDGPSVGVAPPHMRVVKGRCERCGEFSRRGRAAARHATSGGPSGRIAQVCGIGRSGVP